MVSVHRDIGRGQVTGRGQAIAPTMDEGDGVHRVIG